MFLLAESWEAQRFEKALHSTNAHMLYKAYDNGKWAADAYLKSADILTQMGRTNDVRNTYRAMLLDKYVKNLPQAKVAKEFLGPAESAELLAGTTNKVEKVTLKEEQ